MVGQRHQRRPVGDDDDGGAPAELDERVGDDLLGQLVEVRGRLVEQHPGTVGDHDPGEGQAGPFAGGEGGAVLAEDGVQAIGQGADAFLERHLAQGGPQGVVARPRPAGQPQVVGDGAGHEVRSLGEPGHLALPRGSADVVTVRRDPARRAAAGRRARPAGWTCRSREGPVTTVTPRAGITASSGASAGSVRPAWVTESPSRTSGSPTGAGRRPWRRASRPGPRPGEQSRHGLEGGDALGGSVELGAHPCAAASRPRGPGAARRAPCAARATAGGQPDAGGDRDQRDRQRGDQLEDERGGEGDPQGRP